MKYYARIVGEKSHTGDGRTVAFRIIDDFLDRHFLLKFSWTGAGGGKIKFCTYVNVIRLLFDIVYHADHRWTMDDSTKFFKDIIKHAKSRAESTKGRTPTARKKAEKKRTAIRTDVDIQEPAGDVDNRDRTVDADIRNPTGDADIETINDANNRPTTSGAGRSQATGGVNIREPTGDADEPINDANNRPATGGAGSSQAIGDTSSSQATGDTGSGHSSESEHESANESDNESHNDSENESENELDTGSGPFKVSTATGGNSSSESEEDEPISKRVKLPSN